MPIAAADVVAWLKLPAVDDVVTRCTDAVNSFVGSLPTIRLTTEGPEAGQWAPETKLAATMLAARLVRRRNSPNGVEALTEGGASYVSRYDSDIARMLGIDGYAPPRIG